MATLVVRSLLIRPLRVIAGLEPAIHEAAQNVYAYECNVLAFIMDGRVKPGHDG
jgi:hypothetical protein